MYDLPTSAIARRTLPIKRQKSGQLNDGWLTSPLASHYHVLTLPDWSVRGVLAESTRSLATPTISHYSILAHQYFSLVSYCDRSMSVRNSYSQSVNYSVRHSGSQIVRHSVNHSVRHSDCQTVSHSVNHSVRHSGSQTVSQSVNHSVRHSDCQTHCRQSDCQTFSQSVSEGFRQSDCQTVSQVARQVVIQATSLSTRSLDI